MNRERKIDIAFKATMVLLVSVLLTGAVKTLTAEPKAEGPHESVTVLGNMTESEAQALADSADWVEVK